MALGVVAIYVAATSGADRQASSGMYAFGDLLFFLAVFGVASIPATGAAFFFLRPHPLFWRLLSVAALGLAMTALAAAVEYITNRTFEARLLQIWADLSVLRLLVAPLFALGFLLAGIFAPSRSFRFALLIATAIEAAAFFCFAFALFQRYRAG